MMQEVTDAEILAAFEGTNFGHTNYRDLLQASVLKKMLGYHCGSTITAIMFRMCLIGKTGVVTVRGRQLLRVAYSHLMKASG